MRTISNIMITSKMNKHEDDLKYGDNIKIQKTKTKRGLKGFKLILINEDPKIKEEDFNSKVDLKMRQS